MMKINKWVHICAKFGVLVAVIICCGCHQYVEVNGQSYMALSKKEKKELIYRARLTLYRNPKLVPKDDYTFATQNEPELVIAYKGDKRGVAKVIWDTPKRRYAIIYEGELDSIELQCYMQITDQAPEVIDMRNMPQGK